jgi:hypothetical protein
MPYLTAEYYPSEQLFVLKDLLIVLIDGRLATSPMVLNCAKLAIGTNADVSITSIDFFMVQS